MNAISRIFAPLNLCASSLREDNDADLREKRAGQYELMNSTDPAVRERALDEIDRLNCLLRAS